MKPTITRIYSENADFQHIETLRRNRTKRHRSGEFFVVGVRPINQALAHGWTIKGWSIRATSGCPSGPRGCWRPPVQRRTTSCRRA
jgi:hypothetical protein